MYIFPGPKLMIRPMSRPP